MSLIKQKKSKLLVAVRPALENMRDLHAVKKKQNGGLHRVVWSYFAAIEDLDFSKFDKNLDHVQCIEKH